MSLICASLFADLPSKRGRMMDSCMVGRYSKLIVMVRSRCFSCLVKVSRWREVLHLREGEVCLKAVHMVMAVMLTKG